MNGPNWTVRHLVFGKSLFGHSRRAYGGGVKSQALVPAPKALVPFVPVRYGRIVVGSARFSFPTMEKTMTRLMLAILLIASAISSAAAQGTPVPGTCESKALSKDGKPLAGAAKTSFMAKCKREACEPKAIGSDGKQLKGAAKNSFMAKCKKEQA